MNKKILKSILIGGIIAIIFASCAEDVLKSDYDHIPDPAKVPGGVVSLAVVDTGIVEVTVKGSVTANAITKDNTLLDWGFVFFTADMLARGEYLVASASRTKTQFEFSVNLPHLMPNTYYFCQAYALNVNGIAYGEVLPFKTKPPQSLPFQLLVSDPKSVWDRANFTHIDADGDGNIWELAYLDGDEQMEIGLVSFSWWDNLALKPENYVFLPPLQLGNSPAKVDLDIEALDPGYFAEKFKVVIASAPVANAAQARSAQVIDSYTLQDADRTTFTFVIPSAFIGRVVWIGVCHYDSTDEYAIGITNIKVY